MATTVNFNTNFNGTAANEFFKLAFEESSLISNNLIRFYEGVLGEFYIPTISVTPAFREVTSNDDCSFSPDGTVDLDEKTIQVKKYTSEMEICLNQIIPSWQRQNAGLFSASYENLYPTTEEAFLDLLVQGVSKWLDTEILYGDGSTNHLDGIIPQLEDDEDFPAENNITGVAITVDNVVEEFQKVYARIPRGVRRKEDFVIAVANNVYDAYAWNLSGQGCCTTTQDGHESIKIAGYTIVPLDSLEDNTILAYAVSNTAFATGLKSDITQVAYKTMFDSTLEEKVRAKVSFLAGVGYVYPQEFVLYQGGNNS